MRAIEGDRNCELLAICTMDVNMRRWCVRGIVGSSMLCMEAVGINVVCVQPWLVGGSSSWPGLAIGSSACYFRAFSLKGMAFKIDTHEHLTFWACFVLL